MTNPEPDRTVAGEPATQEELSAIVRLGFELGQLRREARHGWLRINENPESVAEHTQRAAALGFLLAVQEGFEEPHRVATMIVFHDMHETRTGDADNVLKRYLKMDEYGAASDQVGGTGKAGEDILRMWNEVETGSSRAGILAKDAEVLEMAFTARELIVRGNKDAQIWIDAITPRLRTQTAHRLLALVDKADPCEWWKKSTGQARSDG